MKGESNDNPEIPDRRLTSDITGLPSAIVYIATTINCRISKLNGDRVYVCVCARAHTHTHTLLLPRQNESRENLNNENIYVNGAKSCPVGSF